MKRFLLPIIVILLLSSCEKDSHNSDDRLVGTKWQSEDYIYEALFGGNCFNVLEFVSSSEVENYITRNGNVDYFRGTHKYTLNYPKLVIHYVDDEDGTISDYEFEFESSRVLKEVGQTQLMSEYIRQ